MNMAGQIGSFGSSVAFGYMVDAFGNYNTPLLFMAGMLLISALIYTRIDPNIQIEEPGDASLVTAPVGGRPRARHAGAAEPEPLA